MSVLQVFLFGGVRIENNSEINLGPIAESLLAYLLVNRHRRHRREVLAGIFWGDQTDKQARRCLNTTLWRLRKKIEPPDAKEVFFPSSANGEIQFNLQAACWLDIAVFHEKTQMSLQQPVDNLNKDQIEALEEAVHLYRGDLLEGYYQDWVLRERERQRSIYLKCLLHLMRYYQHHGIYEKGVFYGQKILDLDPLREEIHREMMTCYLVSGQRDKAKRQFQVCQSLLSTELDVLPMEETQALYRTILSSASSPHHISLSSSEKKPLNLSQAVHQLQIAKQDLNEANKRLQEAIQAVAYFSELPGDYKFSSPPDFKNQSKNIIA